MRPEGAIAADPGAEGLKLVGGRLCLDCVNTVSGRPPARRPLAARRAEAIGRERLVGYADLVRWSRRSGALARGEAEELLGRARRRPPEARTALRRAVGPRGAVQRVLIRGTQGRE